MCSLPAAAAEADTLRSELEARFFEDAVDDLVRKASACFYLFHTFHQSLGVFSVY